MSRPSSDQSDTDSSLHTICTYIMRTQVEQQNDDTEVLAIFDQMMSSAEMRVKVQAYLGSDHTVLSANKLKFQSALEEDPCMIHNVVKVRTRAPTVVANKLMGNSWVRQDHILFKSPPPSS
mmetsp:Transcript_5721/g.9380  ORF Transcript_5721/g.9380 Transcript_5721/m.9380 type:complete len:121 (+) Transcript_5721:526-888(+)|eukprot:scaffold7692_cov121-Skeletonema_menzelii.AAC.4